MIGLKESEKIGEANGMLGLPTGTHPGRVKGKCGFLWMLLGSPNYSYMDLGGRVLH